MAPYLEALRSFAARGPRRAMVPGHKGGLAADDGLRDALGESALALDLPTLIEGVDIASDGEVAPYDAARRLAAEAWGARRTWFLTNGASQGNWRPAWPSPSAASRVVVQRTVHGSTIDGLVLAGLRPTFVAPEVDVELGLAHCVLPSALDAALAAHARRGGGDRRLADLLRCCGRRRRPRPRRARPRRAARCRRGVGRAPGLLRRASAARPGRRRGPRHLEHAQARRQPDPVGDAPPRGGGRLDEAAVDRALRLVTSTSPSSLLLASLDAARRHAALHGGDLLRQAVAELAVLREEIRHVSGLDVLDERVVGAFGVAAIDPLRVCIDVRATGLSGYEVARRMRSDGDVHVELCGEHIVVAVFGLGERVAEQGAVLVEALARACAGAIPAARARTRALAPVRLAPPWGEVALSPRAAFLAAPQRVPIVGGGGPDRGGVPGRLPARDPQRATGRAPDGGQPGQPAADARARRRGPRRRRPDPAHPARRGGARGAGGRGRAPSPRARGGLMLALALALGASVAWGGSDFVAGLASRRMPLLAVLVGSQVAGLVLLLGLLAATGEAPPPGGAVLAAAIAGVAELAGFAALYKGLAVGPMSIVAPISSAAALVPITARWSPASGRPRRRRSAWASCSWARPWPARSPSPARRAARAGVVPGAALAVLAALCFGAFFVGMDSAAHDAGAVWAVALNRSTSVSVLVFAVALMRPRVGVGRADLATVATIGLLDAAANAMFAFALTQGLMSTVSVLGSLYPVTTVVLAAMVLDERVAPRQAAGVAIVLAGIGLVSAQV